MNNETIQKAKDHFGGIVEEQLKRIEGMKDAQDWIDYSQVKPIIIGILGGDGIGPFIADVARKIMEFLLQDEIKSGKPSIGPRAERPGKEAVKKEPKPEAPAPAKAADTGAPDTDADEDFEGDLEL